MAMHWTRRRDRFIPYRNSKLTRWCRGSFWGVWVDLVNEYRLRWKSPWERRGTPKDCELLIAKVDKLDKPRPREKRKKVEPW